MIVPNPPSEGASQATPTTTGPRNQVSGNPSLPLYLVPYGSNLRFFGRSSELETLKETLDPSQAMTSPRAIGIHGLGGVGKSQLALRYANVSREIYPVIAWIAADDQILIKEGLSNLALRLGIASSETKNDTYPLVSKVRDWLNAFKQPFLLIFDNLDDAGLLQKIWPSNNQGSIIITTRSPLEASMRAAQTLALLPFSDDSAKKFLQTLVGRGPVDEDDETALKEVCCLMGGLPLALVQISDFIRDGCHDYKNFLALYKMSGDWMLKKLQIPADYDEDCLTTWDASLKQLSGFASKLQKLLVFFDPDMIPERLIWNPKFVIEDWRFAFLYSEFDYEESVLKLIRTSMLSRSSHKVLSMNRMVQFAVFSEIDLLEREELFDLTVGILNSTVPNAWKGGGAQHGHGWASWETCGMIVPHVRRLMCLYEEGKVYRKSLGSFTELIFQVGTYLWEREQSWAAKDFFERGLSIGSGQEHLGPVMAQAHRLLGNIYLDLAKPHAALNAYQKNMELREAIDGPNKSPVADACNSIACCYTEMGDTDQAFHWLDRATAIHNARDPSQLARTLAIRAMTCLRAKQTEAALAALSECWRLQGMMQADIEKSPYPKHSGDIMLLSRIYWSQGKKQEARELASRTITIRKGVFGEDCGPRVADSLFTVATMSLELEGSLTLASELLREITSMNGEAQEMKGHLARAYWWRAELEATLGADDGVVNELRQKAREARQLMKGKEWPDEDTNQGFMRLVGWMLW